MISKISKTFLASIFMFGTIVPNGVSYIEDDADYNSLPAELSSGWGWFRLSSAKASNSNCTSVDECYGVTAIYDPWDPFPDYGGGDTGPGDCGFLSCNGDTGGGNDGGGSGDNPVTGQKDLCLLNANLAFNSCNTTAEVAYAGTFALCFGFAAPPAIALCEGAALAGLALAKGDCSDSKAIADYDCNKLPD